MKTIAYLAVSCLTLLFVALILLVVLFIKQEPLPGCCPLSYSPIRLTIHASFPDFRLSPEGFQSDW